MTRKSQARLARVKTVRDLKANRKIIASEVAFQELIERDLADMQAIPYGPMTDAHEEIVRTIDEGLRSKRL